MRVCFKLASRQRPSKLLACLGNITSMCKSEDYFILGAFDSNDPSMNNDTMRSQLDTFKQLRYVFGESTGKVNAINRDLDSNMDWDILVNTSDDMWFNKPEFDLRIIQDMIYNFPDTDGVLHYPDGYTHDLLMTLSILGKKYYERFGYIYHPDYKSLWCDNEATIVAKELGKYRYIDYGFYTHRHTVYGYGSSDQLGRHTESFYNEDKKTFLARQREKYPLKSIYA